MSSAVVLAVDFGGSKIAATVADTRGTRLATATVSTTPSAGAVANFNLGVASARRLLSDVGPGRELAAVGACSFGTPFEDHIELALAIDGWRELALGRELRAAFPGVPLRMANDVKAAALAEYSSGALAGCDPGIYLNLGTGIALAVVLGGTVLTGANGAAGEIGYSLRRAADIDDTAPVTLEQTVGGGALDRRSSDAGWGSAAGLFAAAPRRVVDDIAREIAVALVNMTVLVDPARIAVGGGMTGSWEQLAPRLASALAQHTPHPPELVLARHPHEAPLLGALTLALTAAEGDQRDVPRPPVPAHGAAHLHGTTSTVAAARR